MTTHQRRMLESAVYWDGKDGCEGLCPYGAGEWSSVRVLVRLGYLRCIGSGQDESGRHGDAEALIYAPTDAGRAALLGPRSTPEAGDGQRKDPT